MLKSVFTLLALCFIAAYCPAQDAAIMNYRENIFYVGLSNPVKVVVANTPCEAVRVSINRGVITEDESNGPCEYIVRVDTPGKVLITIYSSKDGINSINGRAEFRARRLPDPLVYVARKSGGEVSKAEMAAQIGVLADIVGFDINVVCRVTKYTMIVLRGGHVAYCGGGKDAYFKGSVKETLQSLLPGDRVIFSDVYCKVADGSIRHLAPAEFIIIE